MTRIATLSLVVWACMALELLVDSTAYGQTGLLRNDRGRQVIKAKLASIHLDTFQVDGLPLSEVIKNLSVEAKRRDPEKRGVNILLNSNRDGGVNASNAAAIGEPVDIAALAIRIQPMNDIRLEDALKAITKVAGPPRLKYAIEDYAVVISPSSEPIPLSVRIFRVDPNTFQQGLHSVVGVPFANVRVTAGSGGGGGAGGGQAAQNAPIVTVPRVQVPPAQQDRGGIPSVSRTNSTETTQTNVRSFIQSLGVDLSPPKSAFFNDRQGTLIVRATPSDLELIEAALGGSVLNGSR